MRTHRYLLLSLTHTSPFPEVSFKHFGPVLYLTGLGLNIDSKGHVCFVKTISVSRFELRGRHVCWKKTSPCRLVGQTH